MVPDHDHCTNSVQLFEILVIYILITFMHDRVHYILILVMYDHDHCANSVKLFDIIHHFFK